VTFLNERIRRAPEHIQQQLIIHHLYDYLNFTVELEKGPVSSACRIIQDNQLDIRLSTELIGRSRRILDEEIEHTRSYERVFQHIKVKTAVTPLTSRYRPAFLDRIDCAIAHNRHLPVELIITLYTIVSETIITNQLSHDYVDETLYPVVRELLRHHARDEARHHKYFSDLFCFLWEHCSSTRKKQIAALIPGLLIDYLAPDETAILTMLKEYSAVFPQPRKLQQQIMTHADILDQIVVSALPSIRLFRKKDVFADDTPEKTQARLVDAYQLLMVRRGLIDHQKVV